MGEPVAVSYPAGSGPAGAAGADGAAGTPGSVWYSGAGAPGGGTGINGDYYLRTSNDDVYFKSAGSWAVIGNVKGSTGATGAAGATGATGADGAPGVVGSVWRDGAGAPSNGLGSNGDYYLNDSNGDVYFKAAGAYSVVGNIKGATGAAGAAGATGATGATGAAGPSTVSDSVLRVQDNGDATKQLAFEVSGVTTGTTRTLTVPNASGTVALTGDAIAASQVTSGVLDVARLATGTPTGSKFVRDDGTLAVPTPATDPLVAVIARRTYD